MQGPGGSAQDVEAVIDTGFSGYLTLPPPVVASLQLPWLSRLQGLLADGNLHVFDVHAATILWDGQARIVATEVVDAQPLIGMRLLQDHELRIQAVPGGSVAITALP